MLDSLPDELIIHIALFLPLGCSDVRNFMCVSKSINFALQRDEFYHQLIPIFTRASPKLPHKNKSRKSVFLRYYPPKRNQMKMNAAYDLLRRLPPEHLYVNLTFIGEFLDHDSDEEELINNIDQPIGVKKNSDGLEFLYSDYNRDCDSHRCPIDNSFYPPLSSEYYPNKRMRKFEVIGNPVFQKFVKNSMGSEALCNCYFSEDETEDEFSCCLLIRKKISFGEWNATHFIGIEKEKERMVYSFNHTLSFLFYFEKEKKE